MLVAENSWERLGLDSVHFSTLLLHCPGPGLAYKNIMISLVICNILMTTLKTRKRNELDNVFIIIRFKYKQCILKPS